EIQSLSVKTTYTTTDLAQLLDTNFNDALLIFRLFLGFSKDHFSVVLKESLKGIGPGVTGYRKKREAFLETLVRLGLLEAMAEQTNRIPKWSDVIIERLRSGRGSAIIGQKRGRKLEEFSERVVKRVFGNAYHVRCNFMGPHRTAKCD